MDKLNSYIEENRERFLEELFELLRIPSVSADSRHKKDMLDAARFVKEKLIAAGADSAEVIDTPGHPIVYGEKMINENLPTVLVYGHYDVQPPDPLELWESEPFNPVVKKTKNHPNGAIFARGASDDKGQFYMHVKAFEAMNKTGELNCNVKFMIEGEEEVGSAHLGGFCEKFKDKLACDVILISDTAMISMDTPSITTGLRGLSYVEVEVVGPNRDLHSGIYGGAVDNPANVLCKMIASLQDDDKRITIEGFYDDVEEVSEEERKLMNEAPFDLDSYKEDLEIDDVSGEKGFTSHDRTSIRPSLDVNGIWGGYTGEGAKTVLPSRAYAKVSMRLVPHQRSEKITELFTRHFKKIAPDTVKVEVTPHHGGEPVVVPSDSDEYRAAHLAIEDVFGVAPLPQRSGGSIPIVPLFEEVLGVKSILMGFGLNSDALHSPNEHFGIENYFKGIQTIPLFFKHYAELKNQ
ncbi:MAG: dipeptidase [Saprospirales bacterium]|nr:MAG: dipeptidase [Saprospirales bacterium]